MSIAQFGEPNPNFCEISRLIVRRSSAHLSDAELGCFETKRKKVLHFVPGGIALTSPASWASSVISPSLDTQVLASRINSRCRHPIVLHSHFVQARPITIYRLNSQHVHILHLTQCLLRSASSSFSYTRDPGGLLQSSLIPTDPTSSTVPALTTVRHRSWPPV